MTPIAVPRAQNDNVTDVEAIWRQITFRPLPSPLPPCVEQQLRVLDLAVYEMGFDLAYERAVDFRTYHEFDDEDWPLDRMIEPVVHFVEFCDLPSRCKGRVQ